MKIGIITVSRTNNYGAELQAYALQKKLQKLGYEAEIIDYLYYKHKNYKATPDAKSLVAVCKKEKIKKFILYRIITPLMENVVSLIHKPLRDRIRNFELFHNKQVLFSPQYKSLVELKKAQHPYEVFIVGSDQVWNPVTGTSLSPYFLEFAPKNKLKISYASSFGVSTIDKQYHLAYKQYLSNLDAIAVREEDGVELVRSIGGRVAQRVLDPTLLLSKEDWCTIIDAPQRLPEKYILIYMLHDSEAIINWAYHLKNEYGFEILMLCKRAFANKKYDDIINIIDAGPQQFVELFSKASFVVTNSFHGTAFSVNFNIPFIVVLKQGKDNNSRMLNFLSLVELKNRVMWEDSNSELNGTDISMLNFSNSNINLEKERDNSVKYLKHHIKN